MILPDYTPIPGLESAEGKTITFEKPGEAREGVATLMIYFDHVELRLITVQPDIHAVYVYFSIAGKCEGMVSTKKYNRYFLTADTLLPTAIAIRNAYRNKTYMQVREIQTIQFQVGRRTDTIN